MKKHYEKTKLSSDFRACVFLANTQFHGAKYVFPSVRNVWYDERLWEAVCRLEKFYATSLAFVLGMTAIFFLGMKAGMSEGMIILALLGWIAADCLLVSPLIYYIAVPKPVKQHMKNMESLTPCEKRICEEGRERNERLEKLMKKYKIRISEKSRRNCKNTQKPPA